MREVLLSEISNQISDRGFTCDVSYEVSHKAVGILAWLQNFVLDQFHLKLVSRTEFVSRDLRTIDVRKLLVRASQWRTLTFPNLRLQIFIACAEIREPKFSMQNFLID